MHRERRRDAAFKVGYLRSGAHSVFGEATGDWVVDGANVVTSGAALLKPAVKPGVWRLFRNIDKDYAPSYSVMSKAALSTEVVSGSVGAADAIKRAND